MYLQAGDVQIVTGKPSGSSRSDSYIARHWRGELSLPKSFWINGVGVFLALSALGRVIASIFMGEVYSPVSTAVLIVVLVLVRFSVGAWQFVGIWRSATYRSARTGHRFWTIATKLVCLTFVALILYLNAVITLPVLDSAFVMMEGDKAMGPHEIRLLPGGTEVEFVGAITWGAPEN